MMMMGTASRIWFTLIVVAVASVSTGCENANRSMVFFTGTTLGIEIAFEPNSTAPAKFIVGYKRAEGLMDPIMDDRSDSTSADRRYTIKDTPHSVLAKIAGEINTGTGATSPGLQGAQWFASGEAAEILARHPATAAVLTNNPEVAKVAGEIAKSVGILSGDKAAAAALLWRVYQLAGDSRSSAGSRVQSYFDEFGNSISVPDDVQFFDGSGPPFSVIQNAKATIEAINGFQRYNMYEKLLDESIQQIELLDPSQQQFLRTDGTPRSPEALEVQMFGAQLLRQKALYEELHRSAANDDRIIDALELFCSEVLFARGGDSP